MWWIKADGCDILPGIGQSVSGIWSGDVDHNDGALQCQYNAYKHRLKCIQNLKMSSTNTREVGERMMQACSQVNQDLIFLNSGMLIIENKLLYYLQCSFISTSEGPKFV